MDWEGQRDIDQDGDCAAALKGVSNGHRRSSEGYQRDLASGSGDEGADMREESNSPVSARPLPDERILGGDLPSLFGGQAEINLPAEKNEERIITAAYSSIQS